MSDEYHLEAPGFKETLTDYDLAFAHLQSSITDPNGILLVAEAGGRSVGFLWGIVGPLIPWSSRLFGNDIILYLKPEHRVGMNGPRIIRAYYEAAKERGAEEVYLSHASQVNPERADRLYRALGFEPVGTQYRRL